MLGVSCSRNPLPMGSLSWGSGIGRAKAFCSQAPAMPPGPARPLCAKAPSHRRPETIFWQLHSAKGNSPRAATHSPNALRIEKATQAVFAPGPPLSIGRTGDGRTRLPGPCCFAGGLRCPKPTPHGFFFVGNQDWAREAFCAQTQPCPLRQLGRSAPRPRRTDGPKQSSGSCILQRETLLGQQTTAPTRLGSRKQRKPFSPPAPRSP